MTTKDFSTINLPQPKCSLQVGNILINANQSNRSSWIPKFSDTIHIVEVRQTGTTHPGQLAKRMKNVTGSYICIDNARPELFLRRDFIKKFVHNGKVHLSQANRDQDDYGICSINNELQITLNEKQYRRFGLIAKKVTPNKAKNTKQYLITCDLNDERIIKSNKHQDKLVQTFRRLSALRKIYFRFVPSSTSTTTNCSVTDPSICEATSDSLDFFQAVIDEYAADGFKPVPLSGCRVVRQKIDKKWLKCSQLHPDLNLPVIDGIVDIVDWIGYQLLGIDCDKEEIRCRYPMQQERLDVSCLQLSGMVDFKHVQEILPDIFGRKSRAVADDNNGVSDSDNNDAGDDDAVVMRALYLYGTQSKNSNVMIMRNFSRALIGSNDDDDGGGNGANVDRSQLLTVARMINYR